MDTLYIKKLDEVWAKIEAEPHVAQELSDHFTFAVPGAKFSPQFRNRLWDGKVRMYSVFTKKIYLGLIPYVLKWAEEREYKVVGDPSIRLEPLDFDQAKFDKFLSTVGLPDWLVPRDYQLEAVRHAIQNERSVLLSPTGSGKSLIIYLLTRWYLATGSNKVLVIVPTIGLVNQMKSDFVEYGCPGEFVHRIMGGESKVFKSPIVVSTWQSIYKLPKAFFSQFDVVIGDEAHLFKAKSLTSIMERMPDCKYRHGFTGTLDGKNISKLTLEGCFGAVRRVTTTEALIKQGSLANLAIKCIAVQYNEQDRLAAKKLDYQGEVKFLVEHKGRNRMIVQLTSALQGNTLLLFNYVDSHAKVVYQMLREKFGERVHLVVGEVDATKREEIRKWVIGSNDNIIVASAGTLSAGVNIPNLNNAISCAPGGKSTVRILQSIGRILRRADGKEHALWFDIVDDLRHKGYKNHSVRHFEERAKIYSSEKLPWAVSKYELK